MSDAEHLEPGGNSCGGAGFGILNDQRTASGQEFGCLQIRIGGRLQFSCFESADEHGEPVSDAGVNDWRFDFGSSTG